MSRAVREMRRGSHVWLALLALAALAASTAGAATTSSPSRAGARLQGQFLLKGQITVAHDVRGEHVGQTVMRKWVFTPVCAHGACGHIQLYRARANGHDRLTLRRRSPGLYVGTGSFYAPLKCGGRVYHKGQYVPFAISVRVIGTAIRNGIDVASRVRATYDNKTRSNRTPCVAFLGHDAAKYHGHLTQ